MYDDRDDLEMEEDVEMVTVADEAGRTISCTVERFLDIDGQDYALLLPVDAPVEIFTWPGKDEEEEEAIPVNDEEDIERLFPIAKAVLEEQNLTLKRSAVVLTVEGDLPELDDEDEEVDDEGEEIEELQFLASFYHDNQEFAVYAPLDPCFILARVEDDTNYHLLTTDELNQLQPMLAMIEDQFFDEIE
jgi:hypothetical protein